LEEFFLKKEGYFISCKARVKTVEIWHKLGKNGISARTFRSLLTKLLKEDVIDHTISASLKTQRRPRKKENQSRKFVIFFIILCRSILEKIY